MDLDTESQRYVQDEMNDDIIDDKYKICIQGNRRRKSHIQHYIGAGDKYRYSQLRPKIQKSMQDLMKEYQFTPFKQQSWNRIIDIQSFFIWSYAGRWVDFTYYMLSMERTAAWKYIADHYRAIWVDISLRYQSDIKQDDDIKYFNKMDIDKFHEQYMKFLEGEMLKIVQKKNSGFLIASEYRNEENRHGIRMSNQEGLYLEHDAFYENSSLTIVYLRQKDKIRVIKYLFNKIKYLQGNIGKYFVTDKEVHECIDKLILCQILIREVLQRQLISGEISTSTHFKGHCLHQWNQYLRPRLFMCRQVQENTQAAGYNYINSLTGFEITYMSKIIIIIMFYKDRRIRQLQLSYLNQCSEHR